MGLLETLHFYSTQNTVFSMTQAKRMTVTEMKHGWRDDDKDTQRL
jgi:hypothetical protein